MDSISVSLMFNRTAQAKADWAPASNRPIVPKAPGGQFSAASPARVSGNQRMLSQRQNGAHSHPSFLGRTNSTYEKEADWVASQFGRTSGKTAAAGNTSQRPLKSGSMLGQSLDKKTQKLMKRHIGMDFSHVRIHHNSAADALNRRLGASALTYGSDIFFRRGNFEPGTQRGQKLLAHELTHVAQQARSNGPGEQIQRTTVGNILDEFFSPFSSETLWVMDENDNYTRIVRTWRPVIEAVNQAKQNLEVKCNHWDANHRTDSTWTPGMTDPPVVDPNALPIWVGSPLGTEPEICRDAFIPYATTRAVPLIPAIQTFELYTCSIGSFGIYATVDDIDCANKTATMNIWMYNAMDQTSFGPYASHPAFSLSGMQRQYMWWNWKEPHSWGAAPTPGGGGAGGSNDWI